MTGRLVFFGELLIRLTAPGNELLMQSPALSLHVGGAEANVAIGLAHLGHDCAMVSSIPPNALGRGAVAAVRSAGVDCAAVTSRPGRMGLYFLSVGAGLRASEIVYDRAGSSFAATGPEDYDFEAHKELVPMQPGDVPVTYADTSALERDFGYKPSTSLRTGLRNFAEWYAEFYK